MKYVNQPGMKAAQKMRLQMTKKTNFVEKADLIMKKDMEHKEITREKRKPGNWESTV